MQIFSTSGGKVTSELIVNRNSYSSQDKPHVAKLDTGNFIVTWQCSNCDGGYTTIQARVFSELGVGQPEFQVNNKHACHAKDPVVIPMIGEGFAIAWVDDCASEEDAYIRKFSYSGRASTNDTLVNRYTDDEQERVHGTQLKDGNLVVVWESYGQEGDTYGVYAKIYNRNLVILENVFLVNIYTDNHQRWPRVAALSDGGFFIVWSGLGDKDVGAFGKRYSQSWNPIGNDFLLNDKETVLGYTSIMAFSDEHFVVVWGAYGIDDGYAGIAGKVFELVSSSHEEGIVSEIWQWAVANKILILVFAVNFIVMVVVVLIIGWNYGKTKKQKDEQLEDKQLEDEI